jgi:hypothetical protein
MSATSVQMWLVATLSRAEPIRALMHTAWGWPLAESLHFIGLTLLVGSIGIFDLRLIGVGRTIPIAAMHRFIRWGLVGFGLNVLTGSLFLLTEPDQYVYNPSFQFKLLCIALAGFNALAFYATSYRRITSPDAGPNAPRLARAAGAVSLTLWIAVIVAGRLLTFYRPYPCEPPEPRYWATCIPGYYDRR